jgi:hypothetical protein
MNLSNARATLGLQAKATPTSTNVIGSVQIGANPQTITFPDADVAYSLTAFFAGSGDELVIDLTDNDTTGSTAWVAGTRQVETATAVGTITLAGNATVVVTSAGMSGSPLTVSVPVALNDTAAQWAAKVRTALAANTTIAARFDVSGTSAAIVLTRKATSTLTNGSISVPLYAGNDSTLNISLDNGTCTGITTAATSANTTAGVATDGVLIYDGDGKDFEGVDLGCDTQAVMFESFHNITTINGNSEQTIVMNGAMFVLLAMKDNAIDCMTDNPYTISQNGSGILTITVIGRS